MNGIFVPTPKKRKLILLCSAILFVVSCSFIFCIQYNKSVNAAGWHQSDNGRYYILPNHQQAFGLVDIEGCTYYFGDDGFVHTSWQEIDGENYYFNEDGIMQKGDILINNVPYHFNENTGAFYTGFRNIDSQKHYFDEYGFPQHGFLEIDNKKYFFDENGIAQTGLKTIDTQGYYFDEDGVMQTGWISYNNKKYYANQDGTLKKGFSTIDNKNVYFTNEYHLANGWTTINGTKYYFNDDGVKLTGTQKIGAHTYYLNNDGTLITGWVTEKGKKYYKDQYGKNLTGTQKLGKKTYNFNNDGTLRPDPPAQPKPAKKVAEVKKDPPALPEYQPKTYETPNYNLVETTDSNELDFSSILDTAGREISNIYSYVRNNMTYINAPGGSINELVEFAMENGGGTSQHYSAILYKLLTEAGHSAKIIQGTLRGNPHYWNQVESGGTWYHIDSLLGKYMILENQLGAAYCY